MGRTLSKKERPTLSFSILFPSLLLKVESATLPGRGASSSTGRALVVLLEAGAFIETSAFGEVGALVQTGALVETEAFVETEFLRRDRMPSSLNETGCLLR